LQDGEKIKAYKSSFAEDCSKNNNMVEVICDNWKLKHNGTAVNYYPYCYSLWNNSVL
jgi:hypothetical protein